jgi:phage baseplate assembly protein W
MASGLSVKLPLTVSEVFGPYNLNTTYEDMVTQNLKMLILTIPGERIMDPRFGVGLRRYLFEFNGRQTYERIRDGIEQQVSLYLPFIRIDNINFDVPENNPDLFPHSLSMRVSFTIVPLQRSTALQIDVDTPI